MKVPNLHQLLNSSEKNMQNVTSILLEVATKMGKEAIVEVLTKRFYVSSVLSKCTRASTRKINLHPTTIVVKDTVKEVSHVGKQLENILKELV